MATKKEAVAFALIAEDVKYIKKSLSGTENDAGLISNVRDNTDFRNIHQALDKKFKFWIGSGVGTSIILFILSLFI